jgi:predicted AAA+ superfamily ATPase
MYIPRSITKIIKDKLQKFPIVTLTGPRQSGKTTLLKEALKDYTYVNFERIDFREMFESDPIGYLKSLGEHVIFDEAQKVPDLFSYIQVLSDERNATGQYILLGSQSFLSNEKITQTLAGRTFVGHLLPFGILEIGLLSKSPQEIILKGFYPRIFSAGLQPEEFYPSYIQTYIERDVRSIRGIENLSSFIRFLGLLAGRIGQVLNVSSLANDAGISVNTAKSWISVLEASFIIYALKPYYNNFNKRIIKSPKIYFYDTGLACSLLNINDTNTLRNHYLYGALFENLIITEIKKQLIHSGRKPSVFYYRESNGTEIDCVLELNASNVYLIEIKSGETFTKDYLKNLKKINTEQEHKKLVVYNGEQNLNSQNIDVVNFQGFIDFLKQL